jgi:serine/threonine protein kinase
MLLIEEGTDHIIEDRDDLPYDLRDSLGHGHSGSVEKVQDRNTGRFFAQKTIWIPVTRSAKEEREQIFRNEVKIIRGLDKHRHIIQVFATYITEDRFGIILYPVAEDGDLAKYLRRYNDAVEQLNATGSCNYDFAAAESILRKAFGCLASGLAFMREQRVRHKDIKPHNILVHNESVLFTDFGYSRDCSQFTNSSSEGRPGFLSRRYSAPEIIEYETRSYSSDVFSLGCVFMEILSALFPAFGPDPDAHFAKIIQGLHIQLGAAQVPSEMSFLPGVIILMTLRNPEARATAQQTYNAISEHHAYSCRECCLPLARVSNPDNTTEMMEKDIQHEDVTSTYCSHGSPVKLQGILKWSNESYGVAIPEVSVISLESHDHETLNSEELYSDRQEPTYWHGLLDEVSADFISASPANSDLMLSRKKFPRPIPPQDLDHVAHGMERALERLQVSREHIINKRHQLIAERQRLRIARDRAAEQAGCAFELMKQFSCKQQTEMPKEICQAYEDLDQVRVQLEGEETSYVTLEEAYDLAEWQYIEQEKLVFDDLHLHGLPDESLSAFNPQEDLQECSSSASLDDVAHPDPWHVHRREAPLVVSTSPNERESLTYRGMWTITCERIDDWLFEGFEHSGLQRKFLKNLIEAQGYGVNDDGLLWLVQSHWTTDDPPEKAFHTGETTVSKYSDPSFSDPNATKSGSACTSDKRSLRSHLGQPSHNPSKSGSRSASEINEHRGNKPIDSLQLSPLCHVDKVVDALETYDFPTDISLDDLFDSTTSEAPFERSSSYTSLSTQLTSMTRASSALDTSSVSSRDDWDQEDCPKEPDAINGSGLVKENLEYPNIGHVFVIGSM